MRLLPPWIVNSFRRLGLDLRQGKWDWSDVAPANFIIPTGAVTAAHLAADSVGASEIDEAAEVTVAKLTSTGAVQGTTLKGTGKTLDIGDAGGFSGLKFNATNTTLEFWVDGVAVGQIGTDGVFTDNVA